MDPFPSIDNLGGTSDYSHEIDEEKLNTRIVLYKKIMKCANC